MEREIESEPKMEYEWEEPELIMRDCSARIRNQVRSRTRSYRISLAELERNSTKPIHRSNEEIMQLTNKIHHPIDQSCVITTRDPVPEDLVVFIKQGVLLLKLPPTILYTHVCNLNMC